MSFLDELDELADQVKDDAEELKNRAVKLLERHAREHPEGLFKLLRTVKPVVLRHNLAIVTRYHDVAEILTHDEAFSVQPYREKMTRLAGEFILGTDDSPQYERDISILRLAAPRSDVPALAGAQAAARADDDDAVRAHLFEAMRLAPQGPGLFRRARTDFEVAEGSMHATTIRAGTLTFAAVQSAMLDDDVVDDPREFRIGRPAHHHLHFGVGMRACFGRFANAMQIPLIAKAVLGRPGLARAPGADGQLVKDGPFPKSLVLTYDGS
jgi:cytochrome P450